MRRTVITILLALAAGGAFAQTMADAYQFSENNYEGTARTIAMGNAFTALGGDLGSVTINPAGSAVARYSQFTVTPSVYISVNNAVGAPMADGRPNGFERQYRNTRISGGLPNIGLGINFDTHRKSGIRNWSLGFVVNVTDKYMDRAYTTGTTERTYSEALALAAGGFNINDMLAKDGWDIMGAQYWHYVVGAQSGMFGRIEDNVQDTFIGISENLKMDGDKPELDPEGNYQISPGGPVNQKFSRNISGSKYDYAINFAMNFSDKVFIGANLGIQSLKYRHETLLTEISQDPYNFQTTFDELRFKNSYETSGVGVYGKFGIIVTPFGGLRLGAAVQTPTSLLLKDRYYMSGSTAFAEPTELYKNINVESPEGDFEYRLVSPLRFNAGVAYTLGKVGVISVDYEICDYSSMRYRSADSIDDDDFIGTNDDIKELMGQSHMLRAGLEIKPFSSFAIRAGYGLTTSPVMDYVKDDVKEYIEPKSHRFSFGFGFDSGGSFFADLACSVRLNKETMWAYGDEVSGQLYNKDFPLPVIENNRQIWMAAITLGLRF